MRCEIKPAIRRRDAGYISSDSDRSKSERLLPTTEKNSSLFSRLNNNTRNTNDIVSSDFSVNDEAKIILSSTSIVIIFVKHLKVSEILN